VGGIAASGSRPGYEIGYQKTISGLIPALAGADQVVGIGGFDRSGCESAEQVVLDCELWRNIQRAWRGIRVNEETLAFDAISRVGPGGYFMRDIHTLKHFKSEVLLPKIALRDLKPGEIGEPIAIAAREEVRRILKHHRPVLLEKSVIHEIKTILKKFDSEHSAEPVSTKYLDRFA
jgi:trimethylamine--corrinoid protein Co-methyltransferase